MQIMNEYISLSRPQIQSLAAGFICMLIYGSSYTYGALIPYVTSYIYYQSDDSITTNKMAVLLVVSYIVVNLGMPFCTIKQLQFSNRATTSISILGICITFFILSFGDSFWVYVLMYGIFFSLFLGFGYMAPIKNCYQHIPHLKGLCSGVCILGLGISSLVFNFVLLALVNPNNESSFKLEDGRKIYSKDVADRVPFALKIMPAIYLFIGLIGIALMVPPLENQTKKHSVQKQEEFGSQISSSQTNLPLLQNHKSKTVWQLISHLIKSKLLAIEEKIQWLILTLITSVPFGMFIAYNYKQYGNLKIDDDSFLTVVGSCGALFNGIGRFFWGFMFDKFSFKVISSLINSILLASAISISFLIENQYLFLVGVAVIYFCYGGNFSVYPTQTVRIFGQQLGGKIYFVVYCGFSTGCLLQWLSRLFIVSQAPQDAKFLGFKTCFFIFAGFSLVSLLLSIFVKYDEDEPHRTQSSDTK